MMEIVITNETENDRKKIYQILQQIASKSNITIRDIAVGGEMTFLLENYTLVRLRCRDIIYFEYINRKIRIVTTQNDYICIKEKIGDIAKKMKKYGFAMSHQSFVVNMYQIEKITTKSLVMKNGDSVYLAQKRAAVIRKELRSQSAKILL